MTILRIFVSFEFEKDNNLKNSFLVQAKKQTPHRVTNCSLDKAYQGQAWKSRAREAIRECDVVFVLVGQDTHNAPGVLVETDMARSLNKPIIQVLSQNARRQNYKGIPHVQDGVSWKWEVINRRLDGQ